CTHGSPKRRSMRSLSLRTGTRWPRETRTASSCFGTSPPGGSARTVSQHGEIRLLTFAPDGRTLAAACGDAKTRLWDPITGQLTLVLGGHRQRVNTLEFSPDGLTLASASHDGAIKLWHAER